MTKSVAHDQADQRLELLEEQLEIDKRIVETGRVLIETKVETRQQVVEALLQEEEVEVERVPVGRFATADTRHRSSGEAPTSESPTRSW